ncbi:hypothetical protein [Chitinophaga nivalis]|uniref:SpoVT-AbrB domain-containing protein n=1 Tax=Chitinophaga nivalis TaxID=2991709 RepID=A0ABT3ISA9_9BACT|nr:hypothetical protein [Chitinophaga nivalis]MCW3463444.1 hypothetical protein [Chitinophaga nivalis]MCW3486866.1 hypothetical protein [Chitinophaga nivalis]
MTTVFKENLESRKISPKGVITLPPAAREQLKFKKGQGKRIGFAVEDKKVILFTPAKEKQPSKKASARGLLKLNIAARKALKVSNGEGGLYAVKVDKKDGSVQLYAK